VPLTLASLAGIWLVATSCHQLSPSQQGLLTTFGAYTQTLRPGFNLSAPWPIQSVKVVDVAHVNIATIPDGEGEHLLLTADQNLVDVAFMVRWNIKDLRAYAYALNNPKASLNQLAQAAMRASVAQAPLADLSGGDGRARIEARVLQRLQEQLDRAHAGIAVAGIEIKKADLPAKIAASAKKMQDAQKEAAANLSSAQTYADQTLARAEAETAAFDKMYAQYKLAPDITRRNLYYTTMEHVLANSDKVVVPATITSLTLPDARRKPAENVVIAPSASPSPATAATPATDTQR